ncbi:MAG: AMP-dependent synthetase/ligase [Methylocystaceae bacterium]
MGNYIKGQTMSQAFYNSATNYADRVVQRFNPDLYHGDNNGEFTWRELQDRAETIASGFLTLGLDKKDRVAIVANNSPYWTQVDIGVTCSAGVLVTIYPTLSLQEITYIVNDSGSRYLLVGNESILSRILPGLDQMPTLQKIIVLDLEYKGSSPFIISLRQLLDLGKENRQQTKPEYEFRWQNITLDDWATILYTSGTTGQGKGVILTHRSFSSRADGVDVFFAAGGNSITDQDVTLSFLPLSHIYDRGVTQWTAIWNGSTICYADSPATLMADLPRYNPTWISCVPRLYEKIYMQFQQMLAASPVKKKMFEWALKVGEEVLAYRTDSHGRINMTAEFNVISLLPLGLRIKFAIADRLFAKVRALFGSRLRCAHSASAGISPDLLKFFYICGVPIAEGYGLTETTSACCDNPLNACKPGTVGTEACGARVRVAEDGELETAEAGLFAGYLNKPEETAAAFTDDGWFKTGDLVQKDADGYYRIVDRKKAIICLAIGKNVAPLKLEGLFSTSIAIDQIFLIGDERNFISALIVPNFAYFMELFERENVAYDHSKVVTGETNGMVLCIEVGKDFIDKPLLKQAIDEAVLAVNQQLENFERIKQYTVLPNRFTEERGELTPTQKTKKRIILKNYAEVIEELYSRKQA